MSTQAQTFERASAMPASTWHFLNANDTQVDIPEGLSIGNIVKAEGDVAGESDAFARALADAQAEWETAHPAPTPEEEAERAAYLAAEADATYGGTAQSAYQMGADALEEARSLSMAFEHGVGDEAAAYLRHVAGGHIVVKSDAGRQVDAEVIVSAAPGAISAAAIDVVADAGSSVELSIVVDECDRGPSPASRFADDNVTPGTGPCHVSGIAGTTVRVFAGEGARVSIARVQTLDGGFVDIDDMGLFAAGSARIDVRQTVLGASRALTGLAGDLRGDAARVTVDTRYLGTDDQERDFNYALRHHGRKTISDMQANGVLAGKSKKALRGTIDLVRGCKGAEGSENETVLLVDEGVQNKTVPVILCNEDDVAGNHGATIGHIRDEQLFYLASRGLSREAAEAMFASAIVEQAAIDAASQAARAAVVRLGDRLAPGFADLFDEG